MSEDDHVAALAALTQERDFLQQEVDDRAERVRADALREAREAVVALRAVTPNLIRRDDALAAIDALGGADG